MAQQFGSAITVMLMPPLSLASARSCFDASFTTPVTSKSGICGASTVTPMQPHSAQAEGLEQPTRTTYPEPIGTYTFADTTGIHPREKQRILR